jgi:hypothetical protein
MIASLLFSLLAVSCGTGIEKASNTAQPTGTPDAGHTLLVYDQQIKQVDSDQIIHHYYQTTVWDVTTGKRVASYDPVGEEHYAQALILGRRLLFNLHDRIIETDPDYINQQVLWQAPDGLTVLNMALSPDKTTLAFTVSPLSYPQSQDPRLIVFLDVASQREVLVVQQTAETFANFSGYVAVPTWRDDGKGIVVYGWRNAGAPGGVATVFLDGSVHVHSLINFPWIASNGRYAWHGPEGPYMAECFPAKSELILRDLDSDTDILTLSEPDRVLAPMDWSPDNKEVLYVSYALKDEPSEPGSKAVDLDSGQWRLLHLDGFQSEPVADPTVFLKEWQGDHYAELRCHGEPLLYGACADANGQEEAIDLYVGDTYVGSGMEIGVVGFIDS